MKASSIRFSFSQCGLFLGAVAGAMLALTATSVSAVPVTTGLTAWFDASNPAGTGVQPSVNGAPLSTWVNLAPSAQQNGISSVVQNDALLQPTITTGALNGLPVVQFNDTVKSDPNTPSGVGSDFMQAANLFTTPMATTEMFVVWYAASAGPSNDTVFAVDGNNTDAGLDGRQVLAYGNNGGISMLAGVPFGGTPSTGAQLFGGTAAETTVAFPGDGSGTATLWVNNAATSFAGSAGTITGTGTDSLDGLTLGGRFGQVSGAPANGNWTLDGYIAEVLIYNQLLSPSDQMAVQSYLEQKWFGVAVPEPASCVLFGLGALGVVVAAIRRRKANSPVIFGE